jgi:uncharacterized protein YaiI (UPF0178 family)
MDMLLKLGLFNTESHASLHDNDTLSWRQFMTQLAKDKQHNSVREYLTATYSADDANMFLDKLSQFVI